MSIKQERFINGFEKPREELLSPGELEILKLMARGLSEAEIHKESGIPIQLLRHLLYRDPAHYKSPNVKQKGILPKLGAQSREQAVLKALDLGFLDLGEIERKSGFNLERYAELDDKETQLLNVLDDSSHSGRNQILAERLGVVRDTVKDQLSSIYRKLEVSNKMQVALFHRIVKSKPPLQLPN